MEDDKQEIFRESRVGERVDFEYEEADDQTADTVIHNDEPDSDENKGSVAADADEDEALNQGLHVKAGFIALIFAAFWVGVISAAYFINRNSESYEYMAESVTETALTSTEDAAETEPAEDDAEYLELTDGEFYAIQCGDPFVTKSEAVGVGASDVIYAEQDNKGNRKITNSAGYIIAECSGSSKCGTEYIHIYSYEEYLYYIFDYSDPDTLEDRVAIVQRKQNDTTVTGRLVVPGSLDTSWNGVSVIDWQSEFFYTRQVVNIVTLECTQVAEEVPYTLTKNILAATSMDDASAGHMDCLMLTGTDVSIEEIQTDDQDNIYYKLSVQGVNITYWVLASDMESNDQLYEEVAYFDASSGNDELGRHIVFPGAYDLELKTLDTQSNGCIGVIYIDDAPYVVVQTLKADYSYGYVTDLYYACAVYSFLGESCQKIQADGYEDEDGWLPIRLLNQKNSLYDSSLSYSPDCDFDENESVSYFSDRQIQIGGVDYELRKESIGDGIYSESLVRTDFSQESESSSENASETLSEDGLNEYFLRCLDREKDSYLSSLDYGTDLSDILTVSEVYTGSFTDNAADEYLVIFKFKEETAKGYGDDLTIMAVYDMENIICQMSLDADYNTLFVLTDGEGRSRVLVFSDTYSLLGFCSQTQWFYTADTLGFTEEDPLVNIRGNIYEGEDSMEHYSICCKQTEDDITFGVYQQSETYGIGGLIERNYSYQYTMFYNEDVNSFLFYYISSVE